MIPRQVIEEILSRTDIVQLISKYVTLQRAGTNMKGLCPFHSEKTPSFTVFPSENSFYCFGCGVGGDSITFVRRTDNLEYLEAVEKLAGMVGITIPEQQDQYGYTPKYDRKRLYEMNRVAAKYFHACLKLDNPAAKAAYEYLHVKRKLSDATISHFGLGFAPNDYNAFINYMREQGYTLDELVIGNLCGRDEQTGRVYTSFYNRVMFPIIDTAGNVIAFGGRVMDNSVPKYKNSSDTPIYNKRRNLYALNFAKDSCGEELILCEGYMDVIALHAAGFSNAIATLGTAITPEHARLMKRYTKRVLISYDMDDAGRAAADKAMRLLEEVGLEVRLLKMEGAKDPDEFIQKFGRERFASVLSGSSTKFDYNMNRILSKYVLSNPQDKIDATKELSQLIATVTMVSERDVYIQAAAEKLGIDASRLRMDIDRMAARAQREGKKKELQAARQVTLGFTDRVNPDFVKMPGVATCEENVLGLLMIRPEYCDLIASGKVTISCDDFLTEFNRRVFMSIMANDEYAIDQELFTPDEFSRIIKMKVKRMELTDNSQAIFEECVKNLLDLANKQKQKSGTTDIDALRALLEQKQSESNT